MPRSQAPQPTPLRPDAGPQDPTDAGPRDDAPSTPEKRPPPQECKPGQKQACFTAATGCQAQPKGGALSYRCVGACQSGFRICTVEGKWDTQCIGELTPTPEVCNGKDDDCDGEIDELPPQECYSGSAETRGKGQCKVGTRSCDAGQWTACVGEGTPSKEICGNGKDEDCDGQSDEGCTCAAGQKQPCFPGPSGAAGKGICTQGTQTCSSQGAWGACLGAALPSKESCNGKDDDCDGEIDELLTRPCYSGPANTQGKGICKGGTQSCRAGAWGACEQQHVPKAEVCDGKDNDCDGDIDEGLTAQPCPYTGPAGTEGKGACKAAARRCEGGAWSPCKGGHTPAPKDICGNGLDDDCDGKTDDGCGQIRALTNRDTRASSLRLTHAVAGLKGGMYVSGYSLGKTLYYGSQSFAIQGPNFIAKFDSQATKIEWVYSLGARTGIRLAGSPDGGVVWISYSTRSNCDNWVDCRNPYLAALDGQGKLLWEQYLKPKLADAMLQALAVDPTSGAIYGAGYLYQKLTFPKASSGSYALQVLGSNRNVFVARWDAKGTLTWAKAFPASSLSEATSLSLSAKGLYASGYYRSQMRFPQDAQVATLKASRAVFLLHVDPATGAVASAHNAIVASSISAAQVAARNTGGAFVLHRGQLHLYDTSLQSLLPGLSTSFEIKGIQIDPQGGLLATGSFLKSFSSNGTSYPHAGAEDALWLYLDSNGALKHVQTAGGASTEQGICTFLNAQKQRFVVGAFKGSLKALNQQITAQGGQDLFLWQLP